MISKYENQAVADLDLDPIKVKLMHEESGEGWTLEYANRIEAEYRRFLHQMKMFPNLVVVPMPDVDVFWRYHILDTMKYEADCDSAFGYFLHYTPSAAPDEEEQAARGHRQGTCTVSAATQAAYCFIAPPPPGIRKVTAATEAAYCFISPPPPGVRTVTAATEAAYCFITPPPPPGTGTVTAATRAAYCFTTAPTPGTGTVAVAQFTVDRLVHSRPRLELPSLIAQ
jgi:hypothetical protein